MEYLLKKNATFIIVTNEVGMGGISPNKMQRVFADLQGTINQYVASVAQEVYMTLPGIPVKIKG
ncbi:MAG: bifunctional adenosylcobinamide kinase/adenosylcobinamide-phosphate guanylyltransferase [Lachnospiraceae bacterium]|nr:bifunctional adenosylcobinamide kinase/adenosylcobinamide-phosphate guanylyltransferase [Lachnospiraceae bacterium]